MLSMSLIAFKKYFVSLTQFYSYSYFHAFILFYNCIKGYLLITIIALQESVFAYIFTFARKLYIFVHFCVAALFFQLEGLALQFF